MIGNILYANNAEGQRRHNAAVAQGPTGEAGPAPTRDIELPARTQAEIMREHLRADGERLAALPPPRPVYTANNPSNTLQYDALASYQVAQQRAAEQSRNIAAQNTWGNGGTHTFSALRKASYPSMPPVMIRREVPRAMYEADLARFGEIADAHKEYESILLWVGAFTCGMAICCLEDSQDRLEEQSRANINAMNLRYAQYGVVWNYTYLLSGGNWLSYDASLPQP